MGRIKSNLKQKFINIVIKIYRTGKTTFLLNLIVKMLQLYNIKIQGFFPNIPFYIFNYKYGTTEYSSSRLIHF